MVGVGVRRIWVRLATHRLDGF